MTVEQTTTGADPTPTTTTTTTTTTIGGSTSTAACETARDLIDEGRPADAIALIDDARTSSDGASAESKAAAALLCSGERDDALSDAAEGPDGPAADFGRAWADFSSAWIAPLIPGVLAALGWLLLLFLIAVRVLSLVLTPSRRRQESWVPNAQAGVALGTSVAAVALVGVLVFSNFGPTESRIPLGEGATTFLYVVAGLLLIAGAVFAALSVTDRMRIAVTATDGPSDTARNAARTSQLVALIGRVGGSPPAGVEVPRGSDANALSESTLLPAPANAVAKVVVALASSLIGSVPWNVHLDFTADDGASVVVSRNGRTVVAAVLEPTLLPPECALPRSASPDDSSVSDGGAVEQARMMLTAVAAGVVVVALSRAHRGFDGLGGATDGRSVGLQYLATTVFARDHDRSVALLGRALQLDPGNRAADIALQNVLHRDATEPAEIRSYSRNLAERADVLEREGGFRLLEQRVLLTYFAVLVNLKSAAPATELPPGLRHRFTRMKALLAETRRLDSTQEQDPLLLAMEERVRVVRKALLAVYGVKASDLGGPFEATLGRWRSLDPAGAYNSSLLALEQGDRALASFRLASARVDIAHRRWARRDPEFARKRGWTEVDLLVRGGDEGSLWDLPAFAPHRRALQDLGYATPPALADLEPGASDDLVKELQITAVRLERLVDAAMLLKQVMTVEPPFEPPWIDLKRWRVDLCEILLLGAWPADDTAALSVARALRRRMSPELPVPVDTVGEWLRRVREAHDAASAERSSAG